MSGCVGAILEGEEEQGVINVMARGESGAVDACKVFVGRKA